MLIEICQIGRTNLEYDSTIDILNTYNNKLILSILHSDESSQVTYFYSNPFRITVCWIRTRPKSKNSVRKSTCNKNLTENLTKAIISSTRNPTWIRQNSFRSNKIGNPILTRLTSTQTQNTFTGNLIRTRNVKTQNHVLMESNLQMLYF